MTDHSLLGVVDFSYNKYTAEYSFAANVRTHSDPIGNFTISVEIGLEDYSFPEFEEDEPLVAPVTQSFIITILPEIVPEVVYETPVVEVATVVEVVVEVIVEPEPEPEPLPPPPPPPVFVWVPPTPAEVIEAEPQYVEAEEYREEVGEDQEAAPSPTLFISEMTSSGIITVTFSEPLRKLPDSIDLTTLMYKVEDGEDERRMLGAAVYKPALEVRVVPSTLQEPENLAMTWEIIKFTQTEI